MHAPKVRKEDICSQQIYKPVSVHNKYTQGGRAGKTRSHAPQPLGRAAEEAAARHGRWAFIL